MSNTSFALRIANLVSYIVVVAANILANVLPFNDITTNEISDSVPTLVTPSGFTFSIWGVIYIGLLSFIIYQLLPAQRDNEHINKIGWWFVISSIANVLWLLLWHYLQFPLTVVVMLILLGSLLMIYLRLEIGAKSVKRSDFWFVNVPFSIYLAWICVATVANISILLTDLGWDGFGIPQSQWAAVVIGLLVVITLIILIKRRDFAFAAVVVWALVGIWSARDDTMWLSYYVAAAALLVAAGTLLQLINQLLWNEAEPPITLQSE